MKFFNITGLCYPGDNYMVDTSEKIAQIMTMIHKKQYFVINRPRQYGKTTTLTLLEKKLLNTDDFLPIFISFEDVDYTVFKDPESFCREFLEILAKNHNVKKAGYSNIFYDRIDKVNKFRALSEILAEILDLIPKKIVLMIDEVDKSSDNQIFLYFLGMLRDKYLKAQRRQDTTFHSVILAGLHDVKSLKMRIYSEYPSIYPPSENPPPTNGGEAKYNSPWNIASEFKIDLSFSPVEIETMLSDYVETTGYQMNIKAISEKIHFWTNGYPFLVSKLCKMVDEDFLPKRENKNWDIADIENAVNLLTRETNTLFESLSKNLQNKPEIAKLIESVILGIDEISFNLLLPEINFAYMYGMIEKNGNNKIKIHNKIYEEVMTEYFVSRRILETKSFNSKINEPYITPAGKLDLTMVLRKFQETIKEKYSGKDVLKSDEFLEQDVRMLFFMFLKPIINGIGFSFKEVQTGPEKRMDVVVIFRDEKFVVELKIWRGEEYHKAGLTQLHEYMKSESIQKGYMLIMNKNKNKQFDEWEEDDILCVVI